MSMSDGNGALRKIAFEVGNKFFRFAINPDQLTYNRPHRATAVKTKSRIVIEDFQSDVPTVTIAGTTGFNPTGRDADRGAKKIAEMKQYLIDYAKMGGNGSTGADEFFFHDFTNGESHVVHLSPDGVSYSQDANSPLTHRYEIKFYILRAGNEPSEEDIVDPEIGNRFPTLPKGPGGPQAMDPNEDTTVDEYDPASGNGNVYNQGSSGGVYRAPLDNQPVNPQAPSSVSYQHGTTGMGYLLGYYGRTGGIQ
jgi:hypothetical protein